MIHVCQLMLNNYHRTKLTTSKNGLYIVVTLLGIDTLFKDTQIRLLHYINVGTDAKIVDPTPDKVWL